MDGVGIVACRRIIRTSLRSHYPRGAGFFRNLAQHFGKQTDRPVLYACHPGGAGMVLQGTEVAARRHREAVFLHVLESDRRKGQAGELSYSLSRFNAATDTPPPNASSQFWDIETLIPYFASFGPPAASHVGPWARSVRQKPSRCGSESVRRWQAEGSSPIQG